MGKYQSGQMGQTVNLLSFDFGGSNPSLPTKNCGSSSVDRALAFQAEGRGFEPRLPLFFLAVIAQWQSTSLVRKRSRVQISVSARKVSNLQKCNCWLFLFLHSEKGLKSCLCCIVVSIVVPRICLLACLRNTQANENQSY